MNIKMNVLFLNKLTACHLHCCRDTNYHSNAKAMQIRVIVVAPIIIWQMESFLNRDTYLQDLVTLPQSAIASSHTVWCDVTDVHLGACFGVV